MTFCNESKLCNRYIDNWHHLLDLQKWYMGIADVSFKLVSCSSAQIILGIMVAPYIFDHLESIY
jgi:hypothetical protein